MSRASTPSPPQRDAQLLSIGQQCSAPHCNLVDFLPFKCHQCDKYDEHKHNRVAPDCPFCKIPIAIPAGEDPNIRMERHFETDCSVLTGKTKASSTPRCARPKCGKLLFAPISCDKCSKQFCPAHRFPNDHTCPKASAPTNAKPSGTRPTPSTPAAGAAAMAAIRRAMNNPSSSASSSSSSSPARTVPPTPPKTTTPKASSSRPNPFSATDRLSSSLRPVMNGDDSTNETPSASNCISNIILGSGSFNPPPLFSFN
ncbi:hypothetical protein NLI96_g10503 [Meripilus lineatus]|uniref:AN1-type domain-containing protein n=1 Tax=Meripilus lineatus TaxID=2056292 RepID=A0AAD5UTJ6_9APHY|nr:hypothetical protein NLI96_g10503 [Physisporinus lineatus]